MVKFSVQCSVLLLTHFVFSAWLVGQIPPSTTGASGTPVALLNMPLLFEHHARFRAAMADLKNDVQAYQAQTSLLEKQVRELNERLKTFKPDSPEYKELEAQIAQTVARAQADEVVKRREFLMREARIYYDAYMEVRQHTAELARQYQIALVLGYNGTSLDPNDRQSVTRAMQRQVLYQRDLDITPIIIERLNRGVAPQEVTTRPIIPQRR